MIELAKWLQEASVADYSHQIFLVACLTDIENTNLFIAIRQMHKATL